MPWFDRFVRFLYVFLTNAESVAFVLAVCFFFLAFSLGKHGMKKVKVKQEAQLWRATAWATLAKLGLMAVTVLWNVVNYYRY